MSCETIKICSEYKGKYSNLKFIYILIIIQFFYNY